MIRAEFNDNDKKTTSEKIRDIVLKKMNEYAGALNKPVSQVLDRDMACIVDTGDENKCRLHDYLSGAAFALLSSEAEKDALFYDIDKSAESLLGVVWTQAYDIALIEERATLKQPGPELG